MCDHCVYPQEPPTDLSELAQKFLRCVSLTGQRFGAGHLIDILRGAHTLKVAKFAHHRIATFGVGKEYSLRDWQFLIRQFIQKDLVYKDEEDFGILKLTDQAEMILKGHNRVQGFLPAIEKAKSKSQKQTGTDYDQKLFEILRQKRKQLADKIAVPPYVIFPDQSLIEMSRYYPQSNETFLRIYGVGAKKLESYGDVFMGVIRKYREG